MTRTRRCASPLGPEAVDRIRQKLRRQLADLDAWEHVSLDTRY